MFCFIFLKKQKQFFVPAEKDTGGIKFAENYGFYEPPNFLSHLMTPV